MSAWERERARWAASPAGIATAAMYSAAGKAGMAEALRGAMAEVVFSVWGEKKTAYVTWESELVENPEFVEPVEALARASEWLRKYGATKGWEVVS